MPTWKRESVAANANQVVLVAAENFRFKTHFSEQKFFYLHIKYFPADCLILSRDRLSCTSCSFSHSRGLPSSFSGDPGCLAGTAETWVVRCESTAHLLLYWPREHFLPFLSCCWLMHLRFSPGIGRDCGQKRGEERGGDERRRRIWKKLLYTSADAQCSWYSSVKSSCVVTVLWPARYSVWWFGTSVSLI